MNYQKKKNARVRETFCQTHGVHVLKGNEKKNAGVKVRHFVKHMVYMFLMGLKRQFNNMNPYKKYRTKEKNFEMIHLKNKINIRMFYYRRGI